MLYQPPRGSYSPSSPSVVPSWSAWALVLFLFLRDVFGTSSCFVWVAFFAFFLPAFGGGGVHVVNLEIISLWNLSSYSTIFRHMTPMRCKMVIGQITGLQIGCKKQVTSSPLLRAVTTASRVTLTSPFFARNASTALAVGVPPPRLRRCIRARVTLLSLSW